MRATGWIAIIVGGVAGALVAVARAPSQSPRPAPRLAPVAAQPGDTDAGARGAPAAAPPTTASVSATSASASARPAEASVAIASRDELTRIEIACQEKKDVTACRAAARAYDEGQVVAADPVKSRLFRRIELTFLVRGCESRVVQSCLELAKRYEQGDGVARSERNAKALVDRAKELCATREAPACESLR